MLALIPGISIFVQFYLLFEGNELAWKSKQWESVEAFKATQRKWVIAGPVIIVVAVVIGVLGSMIGAAAGTAANS